MVCDRVAANAIRLLNVHAKSKYVLENTASQQGNIRYIPNPLPPHTAIHFMCLSERDTNIHLSTHIRSYASLNMHFIEQTCVLSHRLACTHICMRACQLLCKVVHDFYAHTHTHRAIHSYSPAGCLQIIHNYKDCISTAPFPRSSIIIPHSSTPPSHAHWSTKLFKDTMPQHTWVAGAQLACISTTLSVVLMMLKT